MTTSRLLTAFRRAFEGVEYRHRNSTVGDRIAVEFYEDLYTLGRAPILVGAVKSRLVVVNSGNVVIGRRARRGDGTLGELVPGEEAVLLEGFNVARGPVANIHLGVEVKILAKAMIKQIDRVCGDLKKQVEQFRRSDPRALAVGVVGVNHSESYTSFERDRSHPAKPPPAAEAPKAIRILEAEVRPAYDEFLVLPFRCTNEPPYPFEWVDEGAVHRLYQSVLLRISNEYTRTFR